MAGRTVAISVQLLFARLCRAQKAAAGPRGERRAKNEARFVFEPCEARIVPPPRVRAAKLREKATAVFGALMRSTDCSCTAYIAVVRSWFSYVAIFDRI